MHIKLIFKEESLDFTAACDVQTSQGGRAPIVSQTQYIKFNMHTYLHLVGKEAEFGDQIRYSNQPGVNIRVKTKEQDLSTSKPRTFFTVL